jgi:DNA-directed RNA polymerase subunit K/omega
VPFQLPSTIVVEENLTSDNQPGDVAEPAQPIVKVAPPESRFLFVDVAALRAKQLRRGARSRLAPQADGVTEITAEHPRKPERIAMEEVRQGLVAFEIPDPAGEASGDRQ